MMTVRLFFLGGVLVLGLVTGADAVRAQMADAAVASSSQDGAQEIAVRNTPAKGAQGFIESVARRGIGFLSDASMTPAQQKQSFRSQPLVDCLPKSSLHSPPEQMQASTPQPERMRADLDKR